HFSYWLVSECPTIFRTLRSFVMEDNEFIPIYHRPGIYEDGIWTFCLKDKQINISNLGQEIGAILGLADGFSSGDEIGERLLELGHEKPIIERIIVDLRKLNVLVDSREQFLTFHDLTANPALFNRQLTSHDIAQLASKENFEPKQGVVVRPSIIDTSIGSFSNERRSCRSFEDSPIGSSIVATCLDAAYSKEKRPIPSAGGLYPLRLYAIVNKGSEGLDVGYYQYNHTEQGLVNFNNDVDCQKLCHVFNSEDLLHNAPVIIVITADLDVHPEKYANRGYRYSLLEAGHAAQNIHLVAQELGLGSLEYGGFDDEKLAKELKLPLSERPLITLAIGRTEVSIADPDFFKTLLELESYVGQDKPIEWSRVNAHSKVARSLDFYHATAKYRPPSIIYPVDSVLYASGSARSINLARIKSIAEGYERYTAGRLKFDVVSAADTLEEEWLSPENVKPLSDIQYRQQPHLEKFDPKKQIQWIRGQKVNGSSILVPVDLVFYPLNGVLLGRKNIVENDSSGMAAHTDYEEAVNRGLLELIERDATMKLWFSHRSPNRIAHDILSKHLQKRCEYWKNQGKEVEILDLSHDGIAIVNVIIRSPDGAYPYMVSGAAASNETFEIAASKAYQEAEIGFTNAMFAEKKQDWVEPENVHSPEDHGRFYYYDYKKSEVEWLWAGGISIKKPEVELNSNIFDRYNSAVVVRLTDDNEAIHVVRVLCPQLVPINFGFGNEYFSHPSTQLSNFNRAVPHFFA
ncbi:MAG: YcaO-like family protein, partial [Patescibacteria group bacterium]